jgi:hypothetical protein
MKGSDMEKVKFKVYRASSWVGEQPSEVEFETLQDFLKFVKNLKDNDTLIEGSNRVIVSYDIEEKSYSLLIYDDHIE